ncbi:nucleotidyltransferase family protein [Polaribacter sp. IC073]|uniref:nucleotidyltransferase family protein n=1 Tax=Polaribacter sp. IC073 TaxID=2508540 RepID=UPI0011BDC3C8|nr:nucleotidyltransferase family protein [Polaribacter sp. IC073]TXD46681.1 nucleotidyltransferase family protein [Polaribacter sp. IC073]
MNYKESLFFVAKCLTISLEEKNRNEIENQLKTEEIDWDAVVKLSTAHYVFPALYCNLKRAGFLHFLPEELVNYMIHITDLNRDRNTQIIIQAKAVHQLLVQNNITPIFLKGTGNLLEGLYDDISERMVGDIDFIVAKKDYEKSYELLQNNNYNKVTDEGYSFPQFKHQPRLIHKDRIAAVEVHKELLLEKYALEFNYNLIKADSQIINGMNVMSFKNQLSLSIIAKQINDGGIHYKNIALRNAYDVFLLSKKTPVINAFDHFETLKNPLNCFAASCHIVFGSVQSLKYEKTKETEAYLSKFLNDLKHQERTKKEYVKIDRKLFIKTRLNIIKKSLFNKEYRQWLMNRTSDKNWQREKLIQLRIKKTKS